MNIAGFTVKRSNRSHKLFYSLGGVAAFIFAYGLYKGLPDVMRYMKIRQM